MSDQQQDALRAQQSRALDVSRNAGAMFKHTHLQRKQEVFPVTRDDLEDIKGFDGLQTFFFGLGLFLLSGAGWLLTEKLLEAEAFEITPLLSACMASVVFGAICFCVGAIIRNKKINKIDRILAQTRERW